MEFMDKPVIRKRRKHKLLRYFEYKILHIDDSPHKIALGFAIGFFIAFTPIVGTRILLVIALSILLRANKFAGLISVCISNVFTYVPICYASYLVGRSVFNIFVPDRMMSKEQVIEYLNDIFAPPNIMTGFFTQDYWSQVWVLTKTIGPELWIGGFILGGLAAIGSYILCYNIIKKQRTKSPHRRYRKY